MTAVIGARTGLQAHRDSVRFSEDQLVRELRELREILGAMLVAYLGSVKETRAVRQWDDGEHKPSVDVVQAWFLGMNPQLDDVPPARLLREGRIADTGPAVLAAAPAFAAAG